jgi:hypothetical protein
MIAIPGVEDLLDKANTDRQTRFDLDRFDGRDGYSDFLRALVLVA